MPGPTVISKELNIESPEISVDLPVNVNAQANLTIPDYSITITGYGFPSDSRFGKTFTSDVFKEILDTINTTESIQKVIDTIKSDNISLNDIVTLQIGSSLIENITLSEAISFVVLQVYSDSTSLSDVIEKVIEKTFSADVITMSDSYFFQIDKGSEDILSTSDTLLKVIGSSLSDSLNLNDPVDLQVAFIREKEENISTADSISWVMALAFNETINTTDEFQGIKSDSQFNVPDDTGTVSDTSYINLGKNLEEIISLSEFINLTYGLNYNETITISDSGYLDHFTYCDDTFFTTPMDYVSTHITF